MMMAATGEPHWRHPPSDRTGESLLEWAGYRSLAAWKQARIRHGSVRTSAESRKTLEGTGADERGLDEWAASGANPPRHPG